MNRFVLSTLCLVAPLSAASAATIVTPTEDVMTSGFFFAPDSVRGYAGDDRSTFRVSTDGAFGVSGAETIYIAFDSADFAGYAGPVDSAVLTVQSKSGGFGADAGPGSPFLVSARGVTADPLTTITDDTNPTGPTSWLDFYANNLLPAAPEASTVVEGFGAVTFDVTGLVNDWISGANTVHSLALSGANDLSGADFLHGFQNNTEAPGSTFLTITTAIPEPGSLFLGLLACVALMGWTLHPRRSLSR